jgi:ribosomal protein L30E
MKTLTTTLLLSLALVGVGAQAAGFEQAKSSAQVATELQQAKASGQYTFGELEYPPALPQTTSLSSQEVQAQLQQAKISGQYTFGELEYPAAVSAPASAKTRADVQQELAQAKASGQYTFGELEYPPITR